MATIGEHQHDDAERARQTTPIATGVPTPEPGVARFGVGRVGEFDRVLDQQVEEDRAAQERRHPDHEEVLDALEDLLAVVDRAGEAGQAVCRRRSSSPSAGERVDEHVLADVDETSVQTSDTAPISDASRRAGVRYRGWTLPKILGIAPTRAIDSVVRAVGRMVVWVDAEAEVSTAMIRILSSGEPNTFRRAR